MAIGILLVVAGLAASTCELFVLLWFEISQREIWQPLSKICVGASLTFSSGALLVLIIHFLQDNFSILYVFFHSRRDLSVPIKLSAVWSGREGSLLLWTVLISLFSCHFKMKTRRIENPELLWYSYITLTLFNMFFLWLILTNSPFSTQAPRFFCHSTSEYPCHSLLSRLPTAEGFGLSPLLQNKWNLIHPVVVFSGFAATVVPFSVTLATLVTEKKIDNNLKVYIDRLMTVSWVFLSLGIIVGAYWAYISLGWGGYWTWDPVETVSLIPWLLCTAYFHFKSVLTQSSRGLNLLVACCFVSVLGAAYITRGGALISIHSFATSEITSILGMIFLVSFLILLGAFLRGTPRMQFFLRNWFLEKSLLQKSMFLAGSSIVMMSIVCVIGVFLPPTLFLLTGKYYGILPSFYHYCLAPLALILIFSLIGCQLSNVRKLRRLQVGLYVGAMILTSGTLTLLLTPSNGLITKLGVAFLIFSTIFTLCELVRETIKSKKNRWKIHTTSRGLIHLGIILIFLGIFLNTSTKTEQDESGVIFVILGEEAPIEQLGITIKVQEVQFIHKSSPFDYEIHVTVNIAEGLRKYEQSIVFTVDPRYLTAEGKPMAFASPIVIRGLQRDIYITVFEPPTPISPNPIMIPLTVSIVRYVSLIWLGSVMMFVGAFLALCLRAVDPLKIQK